jgi:predicted dehydrogenase
VTVVRWGIIGTGKIAKVFTTSVALIDEGVVVAVASRTTEGADAFGDAYGIDRRYDDYRAMVRDEEVDAVYVASPHPMHLEHASAALKAGKPVLVEKAFTMNAGEAQQLVDLARAKGLFLMEAMWTRFLPHVTHLRAWIDEGRLGDLRVFEADHGKWFAPDPTHRLFAPALGGSALLDLGIYPISFASMIFGTPSRILAMTEPAFTGVDGQSSMIFRYDNGAHAVITTTSSARSATRACLTGTEARVEIDGDFYAPTTMRLIPRVGEV